ncbi:MAG TPA: DMT family transporter [Parvularculaceae bacterium]|nr:DMT family transporter [Parvularculaceae bacterium]
MPHRIDHHYRAIAYGAAGIAVLCAMDGVIKHLVATNDVLVVTLGRYLFGAAFAAVIWLRAGAPTLTRDMWKAHGLRGFVIAMAATSFFWCLSILPLAELIVITFVAPLLVPFMASVVLGEKVRPRSLAAGFAGFAGVIVAAWGGDNFSPDNQRLLGIGGALFSAVTYALSIALLRGRAGKDGAEVVGLLGAIVPGVIVAVPAVVTGELPPVRDLPDFLALGALAAAGIYLLARAYANAEAQVLAPLEYTALIWASLIGFLFFSEIPRPQVWLGGAIIIAACLWGAQKEKEKLLTPFAPGAPPPGA